MDDTSQGIDAPHPLTGMSDKPYDYPLTGMEVVTTGIALLERAAHAARELGPFPPRVDAAIGQLGLIAVRIMSRPPSDSAQDLVMLAGLLRE